MVDTVELVVVVVSVDVLVETVVSPVAVDMA